MKLATYWSGSEAQPRIGVLFVHESVDYLIDVEAACAITHTRVPHNMVALLGGGEVVMDAVRKGVQSITGQATATLASATSNVQTLCGQGVLCRLPDVHLLAPLPRPGKIVAIGANYHDHIQEGRQSGALGKLPSYPPAFLKMPSGVVGHGEPIIYPHLGSELDYEVELSIVIGKRCQDIQPDRWLDYVAGYTIINDLSLRDVILQEKDSGIVLVGKNFVSACPMGPYLVTKDEIADPDNIAVELRVNGEMRQRDRTNSMIHTCGAIVAYWSRLGLEPGDVLTTGTPGGGAGFGRRHPERLLKIGDVVEAEIEGIGILRNQVIGA